MCNLFVNQRLLSISLTLFYFFFYFFLTLSILKWEIQEENLITFKIVNYEVLIDRGGKRALKLDPNCLTLNSMIFSIIL